MMKTKLTKLEKYWVLYDVGNSAFILLVSTIIPIYYNSLAEAQGISSVDYLATWGYAASFCTILIALVGPVLGTIADNKGFKKPIFTLSMMLGVIVASCNMDWIFSSICYCENWIQCKSYFL